MLSIGRVKGEIRVSRKTEFEVRGGGEVGCPVFWIWLGSRHRRDGWGGKEWTRRLIDLALIIMQCEWQTGVQPLISTVTQALSMLQNQIVLEVGEQTGWQMSRKITTHRVRSASPTIFFSGIAVLPLFKMQYWRDFSGRREIIGVHKFASSCCFCFTVHQDTNTTHPIICCRKTLG